MGHKTPFSPPGKCATCLFSEPLSENHWQRKYHGLICRRFPPTGPTSAPGDGPWSHAAPVQDHGYCGEYKPEEE